MPAMHEFWLPNYPIQGRNKDVYRIVLGELIKATDRKTYKPRWGDPNYDTSSGSIGFMDVTIRERFIPKKDVLPYPNPHKDPYLDYEYNLNDYERKDTLTVQVIGIEPHHGGNINNLKILHQRATEIALGWGLDILVLDSIMNSKLKQVLPRFGYILYDQGRSAVKRLDKRI